MSLIRSCLALSVVLGLGLAACSDGDYQGGGRRTDIGRKGNEGISLSESGSGNTAGNVAGSVGVGGTSGGRGGASAGAPFGIAGCSASSAAGCEL